MSIFRKLFGGLLSGGRRAEDAGGNALWLYVRCGACGETVRARINREYDLSAEFDEASDVPAGYQVRKEIMGRDCFRRIRVDVSFDAQRRPTEQHIEGGAFITREEFEAAQQGGGESVGGSGERDSTPAR